MQDVRDAVAVQFPWNATTPFFLHGQQGGDVTLLLVLHDGIIALESIGLTLYLPSIFYALAMDARAHGDAASRALPVLLILAGGFAPQLNANSSSNVIGVWLFASEVRISTRSTSLES